MRLTQLPDEHQRPAIAHMNSKLATLVCYATGTGKSFIQIVPCLRLLKDKRVTKFLFVGTKNSIVEIRKDLKKFAEHDPYVIEDRAHLEAFLTEVQNPVGIMTYHAIDSREAQELLPLFERHSYALSFDEVHKLKNPKSVVHRTFAMLRRGATACYGATATAVMSQLDDLYHLVNFIRPGYLGTKTHFCENYMVRDLQTIYTRNGPKKAWKVLAYKNLEQLSEVLREVVVRFYPKYDIRVQCKWAEVEDVEAYNDAAMGVFYDEDGNFYENTHHSARMMALQKAVNADPAKLRLLKEALYEHLPHGVLIFCALYESIDLVKGVLDEIPGISYEVISGKVQNKEKREKTKDWFNGDPRNKAVLLTLAGGESLNLQSTNRLVFFDLPFAIGQYLQVMGRVSRFYSQHKTFHITFVGLRETIDEYKLNYVEQHQEALMAIVGNEVGAKSELPRFNQYVLDQLRAKYVWNRKGKGRGRPLGAKPA